MSLSNMPTADPSITSALDIERLKQIFNRRDTPYYKDVIRKPEEAMPDKSIEQLSQEIARKAHEAAYEKAVRDLIDAVVRFGACSCDVDHAEKCVWAKGMKQIKAWAQEALAAAKLRERLTS